MRLTTLFTLIAVAAVCATAEGQTQDLSKDAPRLPVAITECRSGSYYEDGKPANDALRHCTTHQGLDAIAAVANIGALTGSHANEPNPPC